MTKWKSCQPAYVKAPPFVSYGAFQETRPVLVNCSLGINPLSDLYGSETVQMPATMFGPYPPGGPFLHESIADYVCKRFPKVQRDEFFCGAGSMGAIVSLSRILGGPQARILAVIPCFVPALLEFTVTGMQVQLMHMQADKFTLDIKRFAGSLTPETTVCYLDNPNNPTGQSIPLKDVEYLAAACAENGTLLLVDEAYGDFVDDAESALNLTHSNIICVRSFSKGCGLAGLRLGYVVIKDPDLRSCYRSSSIHFASSGASAHIAAQLLPKLDLIAMRREVKELKAKTISFITASPDIVVADTHESTPSFFIGSKKGGNFYDTLMEVGIQTEPSEFFAMDNPSFVRLRTPMKEQFEHFCELWAKRA